MKVLMRAAWSKLVGLRHWSQSLRDMKLWHQKPKCHAAEVVGEALDLQREMTDLSNEKHGSLAVGMEGRDYDKVP